MDKRLDRIEQRLGGPERHQVAVCEEHEWPPSAWAELMTADSLGDRERMADLAERYAGVRPVFEGPYVAIIYSHSGPPSDEVTAVMEAERILGDGTDSRSDHARPRARRQCGQDAPRGAKRRRAEARAEILGTAWQAEVDRERRRLAALRSRVGYEKSASVSYSSKTGGPAEMSATCARNCSSPTKPTWVPPMTVWSRAEPVCSLMWIN